MDATQLETIKNYVLIINSDIEDNDLLDFVLSSVAERALIYMNRLQLLDQEVIDFYEDRDEVPPAVLPTELERVLATVAVSVYRNTEALPTATKMVTSVSDNGQSISYSESISNFLNKSDADIFSDSITLLNKFRLLKVLEPTNRLSKYN